MKKFATRSFDQRGMVSFIVTFILMVVITIIVLGFAQLSRREQRQALDRQLSSQAFYAAESGVNDAIGAITKGTFTGDKKICNPTAIFNGVVDAANNVKYTCLLIDQSPSSLEYDIHNNKSMTADVQFVNPNTSARLSATGLNIKWNDIGTGNASGPTAGYPNLAPGSGAGGWDGSAILRLEITNLSGNQYTRLNLNRNTYTAYLYPGGPGGSATFIATNNGFGLGVQGKIVGAPCVPGPPANCSATISLPGLGHVYIRISAIYKDAHVSVRATNSIGGPVDLAGGEAVIDSTGQAQDVLRRIQVHVPLQTSDEPYFAVQSVRDLCKLLVDDGSNLPDNSGCPDIYP